MILRAGASFSILEAVMHMIFIGGISSGMKPIEYVKTVICSRCGAYGRYQVYMTYLYFSFFFIPLFKWNRRVYVKMSCCGAVYELDPEVGRLLLRRADTEIREEDLTLVQDGNGNPWSSSGKKRCPACGYEAEPDFEYCPKCGKRLDQECGR